jgi:hypothetical protein
LGDPKRDFVARGKKKEIRKLGDEILSHLY